MKDNEIRSNNELEQFINLRSDNLKDSQKRIQRLITVIYLLMLVLFFAWYNINFEKRAIDEKISKFRAALKIEELIPWDKFLKSSASCFHEYYYPSSKRNVVTEEDLLEYIDYYENQVKRREPFIGYIDSSRIIKIRTIIDSTEHWNNVAFWARRDSLLSCLLSLDYYLTAYAIPRWSAFNNDSLPDFLNSLSSIGSREDSLLISLWAIIDSLQKPFEGHMKTGINLLFYPWGPAPIHLSGYQRAFDEYSRSDIIDLLYSLQLMNHLSIFDSTMQKNNRLLMKSKDDLDSLLYLSPWDSDSIPRKADFDFVKISDIIKFNYDNIARLDDDIQLPYISDFSTIYNRSFLNLYDGMLKKYFPEYTLMIEESKSSIENVGTIRKFKERYIEEKALVEYKIQTFGLEISSRSVFYVVPSTTIVFYLVIILSYIHIRTLIYDFDKKASGLQYKYGYEVLNSPLLFLISKRVLNWLIMAFPILFISFVIVYQMFAKSILVNQLIECLILILTVSFVIWLTIEIVKLRKIIVNLQIRVEDFKDGRLEVKNP
jgi:hypothetical protein